MLYILLQDTKIETDEKIPKHKNTGTVSFFKKALEQIISDNP